MNQMNQILTANAANNLYWLGRHLERIEASLLEIDHVYDLIIDVDFDAGKNLYNKIGIALEYKNAPDFMRQAILGDHYGNIKTLLDYARENAIISRSYIELEAFGSIIQLHDLFAKAASQERNIDFIFMDDALSLISEIWGEITRKQTRNVNDYFLKLGKTVEKVDFHLRLGKDGEYAMRLIDEIDSIVSVLAPEATCTPHTAEESSQIILNSVNNKITKIIME